MYTVIDLFSGIGGLSYPFHRDANFKVAAANEILKEPAIAYGLNYPKTKMYNCDIADLSVSQIQKDLGIEKVDIVLGGPPCQSFSTVGKRDIGDPRTFLFKEYCRFLEECSAKMFVFENVRGLLSVQRGLLFRQILNKFKNLGYTIKYELLDSADYGVPQHRKRIIIVGFKKKFKFKFPLPTNGSKKNPYLTVADAISDLPRIGNDGESTQYESTPKNQYQLDIRDQAEVLLHHNYSSNHKKLVDIMEYLPDGGSFKDIPQQLRPKSGFGNTYSRLWWNKPSTTITRNLGVPSSSRCIHPKEPRALTTREGARLQSFPDNFVFYGSRQKMNLQIGEAVPPLFAQSIFQEVASCIY
ncbi:MAG: DNA cytosine methyltransferase [Candidatus Saccharibacteria bacterium]|nr:DNA cytosine methyltransferase [Candidatus Saccharibacteria bacterium]